MKKYYQVFKLTLQEYFEYRLNFLLWRFRSLITFVTLLVFWQAVYGSREMLLGYSKPQMFAYIIGISFLRSLVLGSRSSDLAGQIKSGELTKIIQKPWRVFSFWFSRDAADKLLNIIFTTVEIVIVLKLLNLSFYFPQQPQTYLYLIVILSLSVLLYFFISFTISVISFWTDEVWGMRWLFGVILLEFMAGLYFPIDVLPGPLVKLLKFTPFPYLIFFPLKIWNEQVVGREVFKIVVVCLSWLIVFGGVSVKLWKKGIRNYGAYGG